MPTVDDIRNKLHVHRIFIHHRLKGVGRYEPDYAEQSRPNQRRFRVKVWAQTWEVWSIRDVDLIVSERSDGEEEVLYNRETA